LKGGGYFGASSADARLGWLVRMQFDQDATLSDPSRSTSESTPTRDYTLDSTFLRDSTASIDSTHTRTHIYILDTFWRTRINSHLNPGAFTSAVAPAFTKDAVQQHSDCA
jgi:hypothetical protein